MYLDLLTRIKNAQMVGKKTIKVRFSRMNASVAEVLIRSGFLKKAEVKGRLPKRIIELEFNMEKPIQGMKFLSKPSRRLYSPYKGFKKVKGGHGFLIVSTPKGVLTDSQARKEKVGGQLLFEIW